jgi:DNA-binding GntR family transcriptional regulator
MGTLYETVKSSLRDRIVSGVYKPGQKIPSESELIREFGVSAITVRRAVRDLTIEGRLIGRQGLGVFVADKRRITRSLNPDYSTSLGDEIRRAGFVPGLKELSLTLIAPEPAIADALRLATEEAIYRHEKVILADGKPICYDVAFLPQALGDILRGDLATEFLLPLLGKYGIRCELIDYRVEAASAMEREAAVLDVPVGAPLLGVWYCPIELNQRRVFVGHMLACAEWFSFEFRVPPASSLARADARSAFETTCLSRAGKRQLTR